MDRRPGPRPAERARPREAAPGLASKSFEVGVRLRGRVLDGLVDGFLPLADKYGAVIDRLEADVLAGADVLARIVTIRRGLQGLRRLATAQRSLLALKVMVGKSGKLVGGEAIQLHGGMGMTNELAVGYYVKRVMLANVLVGDADYHQQAFMGLVNAKDEAAKPSAVEAA